MKKSRLSNGEPSHKIQLRVAEAKHRDVGKRRARIDMLSMDKLGIKAGEVVELIGKRSTPVTAWPGESQENDRDIIRIDGQTRKNVGVGLNDFLTVRKIHSKAAKSVFLIPLGPNTISADSEFREFVKNRLRGFPINEGDEISVGVLGNSIDFVIHRIVPRTISRIAKSTKINIVAATSIDKKPRVTYDEIGGLKDQIKRLREIVELPLRHPEVFAKLGIEPHSGIL
ncbi:MAG TPA: AAA family ATPase, partial [Nitrososphaeraceae archaeon]|nr:AAA family ATPase [Nitrososphaeraceae archaeon]